MSGTGTTGDMEFLPMDGIHMDEMEGVVVGGGGGEEEGWKGGMTEGGGGGGGGERGGYVDGVYRTAR